VRAHHRSDRTISRHTMSQALVQPWFSLGSALVQPVSRWLCSRSRASRPAMQGSLPTRSAGVVGLLVLVSSHTSQLLRAE